MLRKVMHFGFAIVLLAGMLALPAAPANAASKTTLLVSAAASLKDSLDEIEKNYEKAHPDVDLQFNLGSSGTLQKQIEQGAPADLFLSAGQKQMDALVDGKLVSKSKLLLKNDLVLIVPSDSAATINSVKELTGKAIERIAIGQPESVPAGQYAKETLTVRKVWEPLQDKLVYAKDVRQVLTYVESGNVDAGFVYRTDALASNKVKIAFKVHSFAHKPIVYPAAVLKQTKNEKEANAFYDYLQSSEAKAVFVKFGFKLP
ncbi:molybdate ABC transporter substrate-binding protein [Cohnella cholangitidis]|uniref:Molybdate ABC transporter substrate-binding protein n=1 Tax=Cohnella cholangitidis TaxID=2598458 RepID=A0A7G5BSP1_9BACL|nr:molybdate ABC transporter substrate-binding protein [Cohnella cholangitidis]QMV39975.1 molybdate ABC transporter substrate-binding protein [Cohnella cholangitidis]